MDEATRDALAIVGLFYLVYATAYGVYHLVHEYRAHRAVQVHRITLVPILEVMEAQRKARCARPDEPLYGNPSVLPRTFDDWLAEVDLEKAGFNAHNN